MRHTFAPPPPPLPEFMEEAHYLSDFIVRWKLKFQGIEDKEIGVMDTALLSQWQKHRSVLRVWSAPYGNADPYQRIVDDCIAYVDALVLDWFAMLTGNKPFMFLDEQRMLRLEEHWQQLNSIPGDKWEVKY